VGVAHPFQASAGSARTTQGSDVIRRALAIVAILSLTATSTAQAQATYPQHMLRKIHRNRDKTWHFQDLIGAPRTPYHRWAETRCGNLNCRYTVLKIWRHKRHHWTYLWKHIGTAVSVGVPASVRNTLLCIHPYEEPSWSTVAGGLGYVSSPSSYNVNGTDALSARYGDSWYTWPKDAQIAFGYELVKAYGYAPWSTAYHCT
jgi:hypothetical protein